MRRCAFWLGLFEGLVMLLAGCGGGGSGSTPPSGSAPLHISIAWPQRSQLVNAPSSALSCRIELYASHDALSPTYTWTIERQDTIHSYQQNWRSTQFVAVGRWYFCMTFYSAHGCSGKIVAEALQQIELDEQGGGANGVSLVNTITRVEVFDNQRLDVGEQRTLGYSAFDSIGHVVAVTPGSAQWSVVAGRDTLRFVGENAEGLAAGQATVTATVDGITSDPVAVTVDTGAPTPTFSVEPASVTVPPRGTQVFSIVASSPVQVNWSVQEGSSGGSISSSGLYTAPAQPGTYHVIATSTADATKTATATVTVSGGQNMTNPKDGAEMIWIPAGTFTMGSLPGDGWGSERPQHSVYLDGFWIYKYEVTVGMYKKFCDATGHPFPNSTPKWGWIDDHPMVHVSWHDANAYTLWANAALPTEAQWEKAARGTNTLIYPWGNEWDATKCANITNSTGTHPVGSFPDGASPYGVMDMAGNVWEWCADWFDTSYYGISPSSNPTGPATGETRVLRGGSWHYDSDGSVRCACRNHNDPYGNWDGDGFRCVVNP